MSSNRPAIKEITPDIYGTTKLGDEAISREERIKIARAAMNSGVWFHTDRMYGNALEVLGEVFADEPTKVPKLIIKIGWELAQDFANGGDCYRVFQDLKDEGLVQGYVVEAFP